MILYFSFPSLWIVFGDTYRCSSLCPFSNNYYLKSFWKVKMNAKWKFFISFTFWTTIQHNSSCICRNSCKWSTPNPLSNLVTFCRNVKNVKLPSCVRLFATPLTVACQAPLSMGFSRQEYWSGLPFPSPGESSQPRGRNGSPTLQADSTVWATRETLVLKTTMNEIDVLWV